MSSRPTVFYVLPGPVPRPETYEDFVRLPPFTTVLAAGPLRNHAHVHVVPTLPPADACIRQLERQGLRLVMQGGKAQRVCFPALLEAQHPERQVDEIAAYAATKSGHTVAKVPLRDVNDCNYYWFKVEEL